MCRREWQIYLSNELLIIYKKLIEDVEELQAKYPSRFAQNFKTKLLKKLHTAISNAASDPHDKRYLLGKTLGDKYKAWRRVKEELPPRYRLFFRFFDESKEIFFAWLNSPTTLRKRGDSSDVYRVFERKLDRGEIPNDRDSLFEASTLVLERELEPDKTPKD